MGLESVIAAAKSSASFARVAVGGHGLVTSCGFSSGMVARTKDTAWTESRKMRPPSETAWCLMSVANRLVRVDHLPTAWRIAGMVASLDLYLIGVPSV